MKNKITLTALLIIIFWAGFIGGSYAPINKNLVELQSLKQGLFIIHKGELYTVSKLVTDTDSYQKMERIK